MEALKFVNGSSGKRLEDFMSRLEKLTEDPAMVQSATALIQNIIELDKQGGLERLNMVLERIERLGPKFEQGIKLLGVLKQDG